MTKGNATHIVANVVAGVVDLKALVVALAGPVPVLAEAAEGRDLTRIEVGHIPSLERLRLIARFGLESS